MNFAQNTFMASIEKYPRIIVENPIKQDIRKYDVFGSPCK